MQTVGHETLVLKVIFGKLEENVFKNRSRIRALCRSWNRRLGFQRVHRDLERLLGKPLASEAATGLTWPEPSEGNRDGAS